MIVRSTKKASGQLAAFLLALCSFCITSVSEAQTIRYVKQGGTGDGLSWANAAGDLQAIINTSAVGDEIWVAEGTYLPMRPANNLGVVAPDNRDNAFTFTKDLNIYGGFPATGNPGMADRNWETHPTVLSGNLGDPSDRTDNAYHVVLSVGETVTNDFLMDGFTITGGYGESATTISVNGEDIERRRGGGWCSFRASPRVNNVVISGNTVTGSGNGAGWYNLAANTILTNAIIANNHSTTYGRGGGIYNGGEANLTVNNVIIRGNTASEGGGMFNDHLSTTVVTRSTFSGNAADNAGGGIYNFNGPLSLTDVLITGNRASVRGGGIYTYDGRVTLTNSTVSGNTADLGGGMYRQTGVFIDPTAVVRNSIFWGNSSGIVHSYLPRDFSVSHSMLQEAMGDATNTVGVNPQFVDMPTYTEAPFTHGDYHMQAGSPAIDAGDNASYAGLGADTEDLDGNPRVFNYPAGTIDRGAYEFEGAAIYPITPGAGNILYVDKDVFGSHRSGDSWANAIPELADALAWAKTNASWTETTPLQIWVAEGEYQPAAGQSFEMVDHVRIYGGFAGDENELDQRDWHQHITTLSGNGSSVVHNPGGLILSRGAVLDGFTITGGVQHEGGGIYNRGDATFANLIVTGNTAPGSGGGVRNFASPLFYNILVTKNSSPLGAGFFNTEVAGGQPSHPVLINVTSSGNEGNSGPELLLEAGTPIIRNSIFYGNGTHGVSNEHDIENSLIQERINNDDGNIPHTTNPLFADAANGDFSLSSASAAINAGSNQAYADYIGPLANQRELTGAARLQHGTIDMGAFESPNKRILVPAENGNILYVNLEVDQWATGYTGDGSSWSNAVPDLWSALIWVKENAGSWTAGAPLQVWVAKERYTPPIGQSFEMVDHVHLYGGFEGSETELSERVVSIEGSVTELEGNGNSVIHNPEGLMLSRDALLDGFAITQGEALMGAGILNHGNATFSNLLIQRNTAESMGGGVYNTGSPLFHDVVISFNQAEKGAGFYNASTSSAPTLVNITVAANYRYELEDEQGVILEGEELYLEAGNPIIRNSIFYGSDVIGITGSEDIQYSLLKGGTDATNGNIPDIGYPYLMMGQFSFLGFILPISPSINTGNNQAYMDLVGPPADRKDASGSPRLAREIIDIGALESPFSRAAVPDANNVVYVNKQVDQTAPGYRADGSSWANAVPELADVLLWAGMKKQTDGFLDQGPDPQSATWDENNPLKIYVARGTYLPFIPAEGIYGSEFGGRDGAFLMVPDVHIYGGFVGNETEVEARDWVANPTILSGDLDESGDLSDGDAYHVLVSYEYVGTALLDGFTVTGGNANGIGDDPNMDEEQEVYLTSGGGMINFNTSPTIRNVVFAGNSASQNGGAIFNFEASPTIINTAILGNSAANGGGIYNSESAPSITNTTFSGNTATQGGGMYNDTDSSPILGNTIVYGNSSGIVSAGGAPAITYSLVQGVAADVDNGNLDGTADDLTPDDLFVSPAAPGLATNGDYRLKPRTLVIDQGSNAAYPGDLANDLDLGGNPRSLGTAIDMGAYEFQYPTLATVGEIPDMTVPYGTELTDVALPDPFTIDGLLDDDTDVSITLPRDVAQWTLSEPSGGSYDGSVAGTYTFVIPIVADGTNGYLNPLELQATINIVVEKGTPVITWKEPDAITYGAALGEEQLNATADVDGTFAYTPAVGTVLDAGEHTLEMTFTPDDDANYNTITAEVTITVGKDTPVITWKDPGAIVYRAELGEEQLNATADVEGTFAYDPAKGTMLTAGEHTLKVTFTPDDDLNYHIATTEVIITVVKASPVITWNRDPEAIIYGTALSEDQLNFEADVDGTFVYAPAVGTVLDAGEHLWRVTFTPEDDMNYNGATITWAITVDKATPEVTWPTPAPIRLGTALGDAQLAASVVVDISGSLVYEPADGTVLSAGEHTLEVTFTPDDTDNYNAATAAVRLVVEDKLVPAITWNDPDAIAYGTAISSSQLNATADVEGTFAYDPAAGTVLAAGDHTLNVTFTPDDDLNYHTATTEVIITVVKASPVITWDNPTAITYGTAISSSQLNATVDVDGAFTYDPAAGTVLAAGDHMLNVIFTPDDEANYNNAARTVILTVGKVTPEIGWDTPPPIRVGTALGSEQLNATVADDIDGTFTYEPAVGTVLSAGDHTLKVTYTPEDTDNYNTVSTTVDITVTEMLLPVVTWNNPAAITYGTALGDGQLNATADVEGTFAYTPAAGTVLPAGDHTLEVTFTPDDKVNYSLGTAQATLTVDKATAAITTQNAQKHTYDGTIRNIVAALNHAEAELTYSPQRGYTDAGEYNITVSAPETVNYLAASKQVTLKITKAAWTGPEPTFPSIDPIVYNGDAHEITADNIPPGSNVSYTIIDGDGNEAPGNIISDAGDYTVIAVIRQDNYEDITISTPVTIVKAEAIITADDLQTHTYDEAVKNAVASLNHGEAKLTYDPQQGYTDAGSYAVTISAAETANYLATSKQVTLEITKADWTGTPVTFPEIDPIDYDGNEHEITADGIPPGSDVSYVIVDSDGNELPGNTVTDAGDYTVVVIIRQDNYDDITVSTPVTIAKAEAIITANALQTQTYNGAVKNIVASLNHVETTLAYSPQQGYTDAGEYSIVVSAPETTNYLAAAATNVTLHIERAAWDGPAITLPVTPEFIYDGESKVVAATNIPPGATVEYTVTDADGNTVPGNEVSETGEYTVTVTVKQDNYRDVMVSTTVTVHPGSRTLNFPALSEKTYGDDDFPPGATASTNEVVSYSSDNPAVASIVDGEIRIAGAGTATITATVPENPNYANRPQVVRQLVVGKAQQVIAFNAPATVNRDAGSIPLTATSSSNLPVTLTLDDPQVATLEGTTLHIHRLGTVQITAGQAGDANHVAAETVTATVRVIDPDSDLPVRVSKVVSPNGDGINEFLLIEGIRDYRENKVSVFNRNGTVLYEANGYNNGSIAFRGISTGQLPLNAGTYFYIIEVKTDGKWKHEKGWFVLRY